MKILRTLSILIPAAAVMLFASPNQSEATNIQPIIVIVWLAIFLLAAKIGGLVEKLGQPAVLGELIAGIILGNIGWTFLEPLRTDESMHVFAEFGVIVLLFQVGLESNIHSMRKVGFHAFLVAIIGVVVPFVCGYAAGFLVFPGLPETTYLFLGATLTATSVGITARVFRDLNVATSNEARIVLGAAVIDDVLGLIILAVVSAIVKTGTVSISEVGLIILKAVTFLGLSILIGQYAAKSIGRIFSFISTSPSMKFSVAIIFGLFMAYLAHFIGLAPIVGSFAAGLVLDAVHFELFDDPTFVKELNNAVSDAEPGLQQKARTILQTVSHRHIEELIEPIGFLFVPVFFVFTGFSVNVASFLSPQVLLAGVIITGIALLGKVVAGLGAGKVNKWLVGWAMMPRGEVGLIFAATGKALGVVGDNEYAVILMMVVCSTLLTPPILTAVIKHSAKRTG